jgi:PTH1 family peptidyl-tRNA hydrolase
MKMIVGLGNPGPRYARNRHNIGFQIADAFAAAHGLSFDKLQFKARVGQGAFGPERVLLVKPQDYMNLSGPPVQSLASFYKVVLADILVVFDDLDLPLGKLRLRPFGGAGGHNGMRSLIQRLGSDQFPRLRVGIGRPPGQMDAADYVLENFTAAEDELMTLARAQAVQALETWLSEGLAAAMNRFNRE